MTATKHIGFRMAGCHLIPIFTAQHEALCELATRRVVAPFAPAGSLSPEPPGS